MPPAIDRIVRVLSPEPKAAYAAAHVYPWGAPDFAPRPKATRPAPPIENLRLYVHIPFCRYHCTFCFYAVRTGDDRVQMERYVAALGRELEAVTPGSALSQLFMGGGTPTALPPELLDLALATVFARARPDGTRVHTVEASPETVTEAHARVLRDRGIGRVSMGIQTLDAAVLENVHRRHSPAQALAACRMLATSGLILNVDLMYGLPRQSEASFERDLAAVAEAGVHAVTLYDLRLNERTPVARILHEDERLSIANLLRWRAFVKAAAERLGYTQTRWHTFKRLDGPAARHERAPSHWKTGAGHQLGVGMSARSHLGFVVYRNHERLEPYLARIEGGESPVETVFELGEADRKTQFVGRSLGDGHPLERADWQAAFGSPLEQDYGPLLERLRAVELIADDGARITLTPTGKLLHDRVMLAFYPPRAKEWLRTRRGPRFAPAPPERITDAAS